MQHTDTCIEVFKQDNTRIKSEKGLQILPCIIKETGNILCETFDVLIKTGT